MNRQKKLQIIPLGGVGEIGKNMTVIRYNNQILVIDAGLAFPDEDLLGIDLIIPDYSYLIENRDMVLGIIITHGHEDHIGALPYLLRDLKVPVYATSLSLGMIGAKLQENRITNASLNIIHPGNTIELGPFQIEFINVSHSIPGAVGLAVHTPLGTIVHTGDFKLDYTPVSGEVLDIRKFAELGRKGVLCLLSESTNVERPGFTMSERTVGQNIDEAFSQAKGRIIFASFASNVNRLQQAIAAAYKYGRKVAVIGRSMINVVTIAEKLGYLILPENTLIDIDKIKDYPDRAVCILTTGSQGEPMSALTRMATGESRQVSINENDTVIISASPIPGNEKAISRNIDQLLRLGANVIYEPISGMHVSGHASQEELKLILSMTKPKYFIPVHGEYRMLSKHAQLAHEMGVAETNTFIPEIGNVIEFTRRGAKITGNVPSGRVLVDGLGIGDIGNIVLRDRKLLSQDGILIVVVTIDARNGTVLAGPDIVTRGFIYVRESEEMINGLKKMITESLQQCQQDGVTDWATLKTRIKETASKEIYQKTKRRPMLIPIIQEVEASLLPSSVG